MGIFIASQSATGTKNSGNETETSTSLATLVYNDTNLQTADGSSSSFQLSGILAERFMGNIGTGEFGRSMSLKGAGAGTIRGSNQVFQGTMTAAISWTNPD
jgi:hypothetical protein